MHKINLHIGVAEKRRKKIKRKETIETALSHLTLTEFYRVSIGCAIGFHDFISWFAKLLYRSAVPPKRDVPPETARFNMETFAKKAMGPRDYENVRDYWGEKEQKVYSLEEKLKTFGGDYVSREDVTGQQVLWQTALEYDRKGIVPAPHEEVGDFVYRGNTLLFLHKLLKKNRGEPEIRVKDKEVKMGINYGSQRLAKQEDVEEANKRIPYFMDLSWVAVYVKDKKEFMVPALGLTFTLPQYNGFTFVQILSEYKSREQFVSVLAHELTHAGTVYLDTKRKFLETKAYAIGKGDLLLGEQVVALNANPPLWIAMIKSAFEMFIPLPFPDKYFKVLPKVRSAVEIWDNTQSYRAVERALRKLYGEKGMYILGRLNADEMEEFRDTNDIPARIAMKEDLKWKIMKANFGRLPS